MIRLDHGAVVNERFEDIYKLAGEGFLLCGSTNGRGWVVNLDDNGEIVWEFLHNNGTLYSVIETEDGNALVGGAFDNGFSVMMISNAGEFMWRRSYTGGTCASVVELKSGEFVLAGYTGIQGYISMIEVDGDPIWGNNYGDVESRPRLYTMRETEGGIVTAGWAGGESGWAQKVDFQGRLIWSENMMQKMERLFNQWCRFQNMASQLLEHQALSTIAGVCFH